MTRPEVFVNAFVKKGDFEVNVNKYQTAQHMQIFPRQILDNIYHKFKIVLHLSKASFRIVGYWTSNLHNSELAVYIKALYLSSGPKTWDVFFQTNLILCLKYILFLRWTYSGELWWPPFYRERNRGTKQTSQKKGSKYLLSFSNPGLWKEVERN